MPATLSWQKSSFSGSGDGNNCVEVAALDGDICLRESDDGRVAIAAVPTALASLLRHVKDASCDIRP